MTENVIIEEELNEDYWKKKDSWKSNEKCNKIIEVWRTEGIENYWMEKPGGKKSSKSW